MKNIFSEGLTSNAFKVIAIIVMFLDHTSTQFLPEGFLQDQIRTFGRLAAPIMCYLIAEGFFHTSNLKKYIVRLFWFALISHLPFVLYFELNWWQGTSVIWSLLMGLIALAAVKNPQLHILAKVGVVAVCCAFAQTADWNYIAVLWIVFFGLFRGRVRWQMISFVSIALLFYFLPGLMNPNVNMFVRCGVLLAIPLFLLYNGQRGKKSFLMKWGFYIFYPVHLILLFIVHAYMV